jgi:hypothetical protein
MKVQSMFCSGCDRDVRVVLTEQPAHDGHATLPDAEFVCLEIGDQCTGSLCPLAGLPPAVMGERLARHGLDTSQLPHVRSECEGCGRVTEMVLIDHEYLFCTECRVTFRWSVLDEMELPTHQEES